MMNYFIRYHLSRINVHVYLFSVVGVLADIDVDFVELTRP